MSVEGVVHHGGTYSQEKKCAEKDTMIKILWFGGEGHSMIEAENIREPIKIKKSGFYSGLGKATMKNFDVQVKWALVQRGEVPKSFKNPQFKLLPKAAVKGWSHRLGAWVG